MTSPIITTAQAAKILGVSPRTAQLWIESGVIPSWKTPGGHRRVYEADVLATLEQRNDIKAAGPDKLVLVLAPERHHGAWLRAFASIDIDHITCLDNPVAAAVMLGHTVPDMLVFHVETPQELGPGFLAALRNVPVLSRLQIVIATQLPAAEIDALLGPDLRYSVIQLDDAPERLAQQLALQAPLQPAVPLALPPALRDAPFPVCADEPRRLAAVHRSGLLHSAPEEAIDNLAQLAALSLSMPVALVSLITEDKQWFKARVGLDLRDTPRHWAFCNYTLLQTGVLEVCELSSDPRFADNPAVADAPHFRYYAGTPITDDRGYALGSLCVIDTKPRKLDATGLQILSRLARQVSIEIARTIRVGRRK